MKTRLLGLAVVLVALAAIVNAMALSSATVTNKMSVAVTTTDQALIAFTSPTAPKALDSDINLTAAGANQMSFDVKNGIQPNSTYAFDSVFAIKNNSGDTVTLGMTQPTATGLTITLADAELGTTLVGKTLAPGASVNVKMTVVAASNATSLTNGDLVITATK